MRTPDTTQCTNNSQVDITLFSKLYGGRLRRSGDGLEASDTWDCLQKESVTEALYCTIGCNETTRLGNSDWLTGVESYCCHIKARCNETTRLGNSDWLTGVESYCCHVKANGLEASDTWDCLQKESVTEALYCTIGCNETTRLGNSDWLTGVESYCCHVKARWSAKQGKLYKAIRPRNSDVYRGHGRTRPVIVLGASGRLVAVREQEYHMQMYHTTTVLVFTMILPSSSFHQENMEQYLE
ncbi:hypothetical protein J6590_029386 [Homalodisca vitripennis]|nr:hypothetical protein J6590_029386 [Homalodisca vitripennis]